jgi:hypothetical protein
VSYLRIVGTVDTRSKVVPKVQVLCTNCIVAVLRRVAPVSVRLLVLQVPVVLVLVADACFIKKKLLVVA